MGSLFAICSGLVRQAWQFCGQGPGVYPDAHRGSNIGFVFIGFHASVGARELYAKRDGDVAVVRFGKQCIDWFMHREPEKTKQTHMYIQTYMYLFRRIHTYIHGHTCIYLGAWTYVCTYIHTYIHTSIDAHAHTYVCLVTYLHTNAHACMHAFIHTCIHFSICAHVHTCVHTGIHIYRCACAPSATGRTCTNT